MKTKLAILLIAIVNYSFAQTNLDSTTNIKSLKEIVISGSKSSEQRKNIIQQIAILSKSEIEKTNAVTSAELLQNTGTAFLQKSQSGGGSPILRGFEANRVGIVMDGVRLNNAIYRGGHLQNIITIDPSMIQKIEVLYGPSSALYGSDALGGVIVFQSKNPEISTNGKLTAKGNSVLRLQSAFQEKYIHTNVNISGKKLAMLFAISHVEFGDLKAGRNYNSRYGQWGKNNIYVIRTLNKESVITNTNPYILKKTSYHQTDLMWKVLFQQNSNTTHTINLQKSTSSNINRYDRLSETHGNGMPTFAQWYYGPQIRNLAAYQFSKINSNSFFNAYNGNLNFQAIEESRYIRKFKNDTLDTRIENVHIIGWDLNATKFLNQQHKFTVGTDGQYNAVRSKAFRKDIVTQGTDKLSTRYPSGGSTLLGNNMYLQYIGATKKDAIHLNAGLRFSNIITNADFGDTSILHLPFTNASQQSNAFTGNVGVNYITKNNWKFAAMINSGFRAPNIDDLAKVFESSTQTFVIVPNHTLKPEQARNLELNILKQYNKKLNIEVAVYKTWLTNAMVLSPFKFNGLDSIPYLGTTTAVAAMQNKASAIIQGMAFSLQWNIMKQLQMNTTINITKGIFTEANVEIPMDHIPPSFGRTSLQYNKPKYYIEIYCIWNDLKAIKNYNPFGEDNQQYATAVGMPAWFTLNLRGAYNISKQLRIQAGIENIADTHYRTFASGISAPGRNFTLALRSNF
jgi:hemoglobin/transferrin/lactoferrin receptor protein